MVRWRDPNRDAAGQGLNSYLARQLGIEAAVQSRCRAIPATIRISRIAFWDRLASHLEIPGTRRVNESAHEGVQSKRKYWKVTGLFMIGTTICKDSMGFRPFGEPEQYIDELMPEIRARKGIKLQKDETGRAPCPLAYDSYRNAASAPVSKSVGCETAAIDDFNSIALPRAGDKENPEDDAARSMIEIRF
jgi:hypothetical protein